MNFSSSDQKSCEKTLNYLESYVSGELMEETNREVLNHLGECEECSANVQTRTRIRQLLRQAVMRDYAPARLERRIRRKLRESRPGILPMHFQWALAAAAGVLLAVTGFQLARVWSPEDPMLQAGRGEKILELGAADHLNCAINHGMADRQFTTEQMKQELGPDYEGLTALVHDASAEGYDVVVGHRCHFIGREFVHFIMRQDSRIVSLAITKEQEDSLSGSGMLESIRLEGVPVYQSRIREYEVAGFQSRNHLAFVVSDLPPEEHSRLASKFVPPVSTFLSNL